MIYLSDDTLERNVWVIVTRGDEHPFVVVASDDDLLDGAAADDLLDEAQVAHIDRTIDAIEDAMREGPYTGDGEIDYRQRASERREWRRTQGDGE